VALADDTLAADTFTQATCMVTISRYEQ
jgi:hypothetical protein